MGARTEDAGSKASILRLWLVEGTKGDRLEIPQKLLHAWGQEDMKVLLSEHSSPLDR